MENGRLAAHALRIDIRACVDIGSAIQQQPCGIEIPVLRCHVQQGRALKR
jgi:hypothetical protein